MDIFNFPLHKREYKYLNNSDTIQLGKGYSFVAKPRSPMLKEFILAFTGFRYYFDSLGKIDYTTNANKDNIAALTTFYEKKGTWDSFIYKDEQFGDVKVRFKQPMEVPQTMGKKAVVGDFQIILSEVGD